METQQLIREIDDLPVWARQQAEDFIIFLQTRYGTVPTDHSIAEAPAPTDAGATLLPPLNLQDAPTSWPANPFMNPEFFGDWADRSDIIDSTEYVRELRRAQWEPHA